MATPVIAVGDTLEIKVGTYCVNQAGINVMHFDVESIVGTVPQISDVATAIDNALHTGYKAYLGANASYYGVLCQRVRPGGASIIAVSAAHIGLGAVGNLAALPGQVSGILTKQTPLAGRGNRGRIYMPFPGEVYTTSPGNTPSATFLTRMAFMQSFLKTDFTITSGANVTTLQPVIYNRLTGARVSVIECRINEKWASQRRRGNYGAQNPYPPF